jgi:hypothetical protein
MVTVRLTARGETRWKAFAKQAARNARSRGVPDLLIVVVDGAYWPSPTRQTFCSARGHSS